MSSTRVLGLALAALGGISLLATQGHAQIIGKGNHLNWKGNFQPAPTQTVGDKVDGGGKIEPTEGQAGFPVCFGDGTGMKCPNNHTGQPGHGCDNSALTGGALFFANGAAKLSKDTMILHVTGVPANSTVLFVQADALAKFPVTFGDGILCLGSPLTTVGVKRATYGQALYPEYGDELLSQKGQVPGTRTTLFYQVIYRDEGAAANHKMHFNLSNAWETVWAP